MPTWRSDTIAANGLRIHYTRTGGDKPPLVLAHGFSDDGLCWTPVAEVLQSGYDIIMPDARGHGRSEAPEFGYALTDMAADLAGVITGLGLEQPAIMGHSMGGATTMVLAGTYPELPGAILIEDAGERNLASSQAPDAEEHMAQRRAELAAQKAKPRAELIADGRARSPEWSDAEWEPWADAKLRFNLNAVQRMGTSVSNWRELLARTTCPALLITADPERGALVTPEAAAEMQELMPQLQVEYVAGAGHSTRRNQFDRFMHVVQSFLNAWKKSRG